MKKMTAVELERFNYWRSQSEKFSDIAKTHADAIASLEKQKILASEELKFNIHNLSLLHSINALQALQSANFAIMMMEVYKRG